jgi:hypothetical protein
VMMKAMLSKELWSLLSTSIHGVHSVPRGHASPSRCQLTIPYSNPSFAGSAEALAWREPGRSRTTLMHFRGRVMNRVRGTLVRRYGKLPSHLIEAAHPSTAARCNLNKCSARALEKVSFPTQREHVLEMTKSLFCIVPLGDSPPSSRLYLAIAAGCLPVIISDHFEGAFAHAVPWRDFSLRVPESSVRPGTSPTAFNLTAHLQAVALETPRLRAMQLALQKHAADVLWEAPGSRVGDHALDLATSAVRQTCSATATPTPTSGVAPGGDAAVAPPGPQVVLIAPGA